MDSKLFTRRHVAMAIGTLPLTVGIARARPIAGTSARITDFGAVADGAKIATAAIQATIDDLAKRGGGTVMVPAGVFVSGAIFLKPRVHLHLERGAVLKCSTDMTNFPPQRTRIEGHFEERFTPALINASGCDGLKITGSGTLDGAGRPIWDQFWKLHDAAPDPGNFPNLGLPRARLALIERSRGVTVEGITFKDSQFWNLHIYRCEDVLVRQVRFVVPDDYKQAPSTDGIDLDSCRRVTIDGCYFSVTDDCIAAKGTKGPFALQDKDSPPVEQIRVRNCEFRRGHHAFACGSEATIVRDVIVENCRVTGAVVLAMFKLRPDTPQTYENIQFRNITLDSDGGTIVNILPWTQYRDLKGAKPPLSNVRNVTFDGIRGRFGALGAIRPNPGQTTIGGIVLQNFDVRLQQPALAVAGSPGVQFRNVRINGAAASAPGTSD